MEIKSLDKIDFDTIYTAFSKAFSDYDYKQSHSGLRKMLTRRGFNPKLSFAAFKGEDIIAFTLNGIGSFNGNKMAYDTGTGTLKQFRGQGLATKIFEYSIPFLKKENINHYLLEVLQHNTKAVSLYQKINFKITREFNYFIWNNEEFKNEVEGIHTPFKIKSIDIKEYDIFSGFWDFSPSWQNSLESIQRTREDFITLGAYMDKKLIGYCILEPHSGDITQLAVDKLYRRKGVASVLLFEANKQNKCSTTKIVNADISCRSIVDFLKAKSVEITGKQFEMIKEI